MYEQLRLVAEYTLRCLTVVPSMYVNGVDPVAVV